MTSSSKSRYAILLILIAILASACNLTSAPQEQLALTSAPTTTPQVTRTLLPTGGIPTTLPLTRFVIPTARPGQIPPTTVILPPTWVASAPTSTPLPISIVILSPIPGNVVAGTVQVLGSAIHPQFLQYQLEFGPDPNPGNLWFPATGIVQTPILNGLLGIWNTTSVQDSSYQLRLRVYLRDGSSLYTVVNNIRIQNQVPTPIPSNTPNVQRPIAAFTQDRASGQAPLIVRFSNQSSGQITSYSWNFGDGGTSPDPNPTYTFRSPGVFNVTLTVTGPGGSSNVSRQINVQSATAPVAAFTQDRVSGPSPLTVKFTNQSTGQINTYNWNFGDGTTGTEQSPSHQFTAVGTYNVILTVTGQGGSSSVTRKITVEDPVVPPPVAAFNTDKNGGDAPLPVQFINQSTGQIQSYNWDFGDGATSTDANPAHTFTNPGNYTVKLTVVGPGGQNAAQTTIAVTQKPNAPVASLSANPTSGNTPLPIQFSSQSTGQITSYQWDFGDGTTSTEQNPSHTYNTAGTYTVKLTVTGPGGSDEEMTTISAAQPIAPPVAAFTQDKTEGPAGLTVQFTNQSSGQNLTHSWDFGDGSTSDAVSPSHTFNNSGTYTVRLTVTNQGGSDSADVQINVTAPVPTDTPAPTVTPAPAAPVASFSAVPASGNAPLMVQFTNQSTGDITGVTWNFGDNTPESNEQNPAHTFSAAGAYTVTLSVTGPGGSNSTQQSITVNPPPAAAPVAAFSADPASGNAPLTVQFTNQSTGDITGVTWNFGDNTPESNEQNPSHIYDVANTYIVTLTVTGPGGSNSTQQTITVNPPPAAAPVAAFSAEPISGDAPLTVQFTNQSTGDITGVTWNFGDNTPESNEQNPSHTYDAANTYTVTLTVTGPGGSNTATQTITVNQGQPPAPSINDALAFTSDQDNGNNDIFVLYPDGRLVNLTGTSADDNSPAWSPDGSKIAFVSDRDGNNEIYVMNEDGTNLINLTNNPANDTNPVWSPDGSKIAFVTNRDGNLEIYAMNPDGSDLLNTTNNTADDFSPVIAGDGSLKMAFVSNRDGNNEIYVLTQEGTLTNLTNNTDNDNSPAWKSDGSQLLFVTNRDGNNEVYVMDADGNNQANLTNNNANDNDPAWSPDDTQIAFVTDRDGNNEIYVMDTDGNNQANLTNNNANDNSPDWRP